MSPAVIITSLAFVYGAYYAARLVWQTRQATPATTTLQQNEDGTSELITVAAEGVNAAIEHGVTATHHSIAEAAASEAGPSLASHAVHAVAHLFHH